MKNITVKEFNKRLKKDVVILDVRTKQEYLKEHIPNAILIDFYDIDFENQIDILDKTKTYLVYCAIGKRSYEAMLLMDSFGFENVYNLIGGINIWKLNEVKNENR